MAPRFVTCAGPAAALGIPPPVPARPVALAASSPLGDALRAAQQRMRDGRPAEALVFFDLALAHAPDLPLAHLGRAFCLGELGRDQEAGEAVARALAAPSEDGLLPLHLAAVCARAGQPTLAMGLLEVAVTASPGKADLALRDPAFAGLRDHPRFLLICGVL